MIPAPAWRACLVSVGAELVSGLQVNDNAAYIAQELGKIGVEVEAVEAVPDKLEPIRDALRRALSRCNLTIVTGGLGPTDDDLTREAVAETLGRRLEVSEQTESLLRAKLGRPTAGQLRQAHVPSGGRTIPATTGTAPGIRLEEAGKLLYLLPGVPYEMREMMQESVLPEVREMAPPSSDISRMYKFCGIGEVSIEERLGGLLPEGVKLSLLPRTGVVFAQVRASPGLVRELDERVPVLFEREYYGRDADTLERVVASLLLERGLKVGIAESCTGGLVGKMLTDVPGSSAFFAGGVVAYANEVKTKVVGVPDAVLGRYGAVSPEAAAAMAEGIRRMLLCDLGVGVTGIAGPSGGSPEKPVGLVHIAVSGGSGNVVEAYQLIGTRPIVRLRAARYALNLLRLTVLGKARVA